MMCCWGIPQSPPKNKNNWIEGFALICRLALRLSGLMFLLLNAARERVIIDQEGKTPLPKELRKTKGRGKNGCT